MYSKSAAFKPQLQDVVLKMTTIVQNSDEQKLDTDERNALSVHRVRDALRAAEGACEQGHVEEIAKTCKAYISELNRVLGYIKVGLTHLHATSWNAHVT